MNTNLGEVKVHACDCVSDPMTIKVKLVGMTQFRFRMAIVKRLFKLIRLIAPMSVAIEMEIEH
jgi:hypothetical protein